MKWATFSEMSSPLLSYIHTYNLKWNARIHWNSPIYQLQQGQSYVVSVSWHMLRRVVIFVVDCWTCFQPGLKLVDPVCTFLFSLVVLVTTLSVLRDATLVLMEGFPRHLDHTAIVSTLRAIDGVRTVHNLHVWSLTLNKYALAVHLSVGELLSKLCGSFADSLILSD